jgi:hypothetical protein
MMKRISESMLPEVHRLLLKPQRIVRRHSMILEEVKRRLWIVGPSPLKAKERANE